MRIIPAILFRSPEMDVRWHNDSIEFVKRPGILLWFALGCVAAVGVFTAFNKIVPSAAQQQFTAGVAKVLAGFGGLFVLMSTAQTLVPRLRVRAIINTRTRTAQLAGRTVPFDAIAGYVVSPHLSNYSKLSATFTSGAAPFLLTSASAQQRAELEALQQKLARITGAQDTSELAAGQLAVATSRAFTLIAVGVGSVFLLLGLTAFNGLVLRPIGSSHGFGLPLWALSVPAYALAFSAWWSTRSTK